MNKKILRKLTIHILKILTLCAYKIFLSNETIFCEFLLKNCREFLVDCLIYICCVHVLKITKISYEILELYRLVRNPSNTSDFIVDMILDDFLNNINIDFVIRLSRKFIYLSSLSFSLFWAVNSHVYVYYLLFHLLSINK